MAMNDKALVSYEFSRNGRVLGRATWLIPGMVELDFSDQTQRQDFVSHFVKRLGRESHGEREPALEMTQVFRFWPDESRWSWSYFAEACQTVSDPYSVRRVL
jgi:hypothetical protein